MQINNYYNGNTYIINYIYYIIQVNIVTERTVSKREEILSKKPEGLRYEKNDRWKGYI